LRCAGGTVRAVGSVNAINNYKYYGKVGLLTGCQDRLYAFGLALALVSSGFCLEVIGGDSEDFSEIHTTCNLRFLNLGGVRPEKPILRRKLLRLSRYYARPIRYGMLSKSQAGFSGDAESKP
jgi:hypothetical protein